MRAIFVRVFLLAMLCPLFAGAQENPLAPGHPGAWKVPPPVKPGSLPAALATAERPAVTALVGQLFDILRAMPELAPPSGFEVFPYARAVLDTLDEVSGSTATKYAEADVMVNIAPYERTPQGVNGNERDTAGSIEIKTNDLQPLLGNGMTELGKSWLDKDGQFVENPPEPAGMLHGYPVYEEGNGSKWVLMSRRGVPFFAPVTRERYLALFMKYVQERLTEIQNNRAKMSAGPPANITTQMDGAVAHFQQVLSDSKSQEASMGAEERNAPAILTTRPGDDAPQFIADPSGGTSILCFNPGLMDKALPRTAVQIIAIHFSSDEEHWPGMAEKLENDLDWAGLEKLLHQ